MLKGFIYGFDQDNLFNYSIAISDLSAVKAVYFGKFLPINKTRKRGK